MLARPMPCSSFYRFAFQNLIFRSKKLCNRCHCDPSHVLSQRGLLKILSKPYCMRLRFLVFIELHRILLFVCGWSFSLYFSTLIHRFLICDVLSILASPSKSPFQAASTDSNFDLMIPESRSNRGGVLLYSPGKKKVEFSTFVQPFVISTRKQVRPKITKEAWIQHMIHLHTTRTTGKRNRACRGGKRKRAENEELIWSLENILDSLEKRKGLFFNSEMLGEDEATALDHLWLHFDGNIDAAEFNMLVKLSGGQG